MARLYRLASLATTSRKVHLSNKGDALAEGLTRVVHVRWTDGYKAATLATPAGARELAAWAAANALFAFRPRVRDVVTGRFVSAN